MLAWVALLIAGQATFDFNKVDQVLSCKTCESVDSVSAYAKANVTPKRRGHHYVVVAAMGSEKLYLVTYHLGDGGDPLLDSVLLADADTQEQFASILEAAKR